MKKIETSSNSWDESLKEAKLIQTREINSIIIKLDKIFRVERKNKKQ